METQSVKPRGLKYRKLKTLVLMQLQEKLNLNKVKDNKAALFKVLYAVIGFAVSTAVIFGLFYIGVLLNVLSLVKNIPDFVLIFLVTLMQLISIFSCTYGLMKSFYFSLDNPLLMTFPVMPNEIFLSKLIVYYVLELKRSLTFLLPIFMAYGIYNYILDGLSGGDILYFFIVILSFPILSLVPVIAGAILSIPAMWLNMLLRQVKVLSFTLFVILGAGITVTVFYVVSLIPPDFNIIRDFKNYYWGVRNFLIAFSEFFAPFAAMSRMVTGENTGLTHLVFPLKSLFTFLMLSASIGTGTVFIYFLNRPLFFKMASKPFEYKKSLFGLHGKNRVTGPFLSGIKKEALVLIRSPQLFFQSFFMVLLLPLAIFLMDKLFASMDTDLLGQFLSVCFNILIILLILTTGNTVAASLFSREGKALYQLKTKPAGLPGVILAKLMPNIVITSISMLATSTIMLGISMLPVRDSVYIFFFAIFISFGHLLQSAELDILNPQYEHYADDTSDVTNPNENKSIGHAFFLSFAFFGISLFLYIEDPKIVWIKLTLLAAAYFGSRVWLFTQRAKVYFKDM